MHQCENKGIQALLSWTVFVKEILNQGLELYFSSGDILTDAARSLVCERPPVCMVLSFTNLLLSLFTANKGDNYVMSTFRRLEVGSAVCMVLEKD